VEVGILVFRAASIPYILVSNPAVLAVSVANKARGDVSDNVMGCTTNPLQ